MEPVTVAASLVVSFLARYADHLAGVAGKVVDDALTDRLRAIWIAVRRRFSTNPESLDALDQLEAHPDDANTRAIVADRVTEALGADPTFAALLTRLVAQAQRGEVSRNEVRDAGAVAMGGDVTISGGTYAVGRDLTFSAPPPEPPRRD